MMPPKGLVQQLVLVHRPKQITIEQRDVVRQLLGAQRLNVHINAIGGALLLRQWRQRVQMVFRCDENAPVQAQRRRYADIVVLEDATLAVRVDLHQHQIIGGPIQLQFVRSTGFYHLGGGAHREAKRAVRVIGAIDAENYCAQQSF